MRNARIPIPAFGAGLLVVAGLFSISPMAAIVAIGGLVLAIPVLRWLDAWRILVLASLFASFLRTHEYGQFLSENVWLVMQFGTLLVAIPTLMLQATSSTTGPRRTVSRAIVGLAIWSCLSSLWSSSPSHSLQQGLLFLLAAAFLHTTAGHRWGDREVLHADLLTIFVAIVFVQTVGLVGGILGLDWALLYGDRFQGLLPNPNYTGILSAFGLILSLYLMGFRRHTALLTASQGVLAVTMMWSGSRGAVAALVIAALVSYMTPAGRAIRLRIAFAALISLLLVPLVAPQYVTAILTLFNHQGGGSDFSSGRFDLWSNLLGLWQDHWVLGIGYRTIETLTEAQGLAAHNLFLQFFVETGIVGGVASLYIFVIAWVRRDRIGHAGLLAGAALGVGVVEMTEASLTGFGNAIALVGWILVVTSVQNQEPDKRTSEIPNDAQPLQLSPPSDPSTLTRTTWPPAP